jgi:acetyl-CoA acyltransferase
MEAVIVESLRTPLGKSHRGAWKATRPDELAAHCIRAVLDRVPQLAREEIEDVIFGCGYPCGAQGHNIARVAALRAGLPPSIAATTVNRFCASGLQAVAMAAHQVIQEGAGAAIAGGVESISFLERQKNANPWVEERYPGLYMVMGDTAEVVAKRYGISRERQDEYALLSQQRTAAAQASGFFAGEIAPITGLEKDECNRPDTTLEGLAKLRPYFDPEHGTVTAGNASQLSDGASATLVMSRERAAALGIRPKLLYRGYAVAGCEPDEMGIGPVFAVPKLLSRHGLKAGDIDLWELNEAFAVQVLYCRDRLEIDPSKLNVNGGSISIGHPFGMTGSRLAGTLANEMARRRARLGVVTMCVGGGQGAAALFERTD